MSDTLTTHEIAEALSTDDKSARRFLRTVFPHQDHARWEVKESDLDMLKLLYLCRRMGKEDMLRLFSKEH